MMPLFPIQGRVVQEPPCDVTKADFRQYTYAAVKMANWFAFHPFAKHPDADHLRIAREFKRLSLENSSDTDAAAKICAWHNRYFRRSKGLWEIGSCAEALERYGSPAAMPEQCSVCGKELHFNPPAEPSAEAPRAIRAPIPSNSSFYYHLTLLGLLLPFIAAMAFIQVVLYPR